MERLSFDLDSEALLTRSEMLLPILMKEDLKTTTNEACDDGKHADRVETDGNFIVIKAYKVVDRCYFPFLYLLEYDSCKSHIFP
jgi:hypothetical protein